jgi:hypothetical protein
LITERGVKELTPTYRFTVSPEVGPGSLSVSCKPDTPTNKL